MKNDSKRESYEAFVIIAACIEHNLAPQDEHWKVARYSLAHLVYGAMTKKHGECMRIIKVMWDIKCVKDRIFLFEKWEGKLSSLTHDEIHSFVPDKGDFGGHGEREMWEKLYYNINSGFKQLLKNEELHSFSMDIIKRFNYNSSKRGLI